MAKTYYVSGKGSDKNSGLNINSPFQTLQKAADLTQPGDTVYVMDGTYTQSNAFANILSIKNSGTTDAWITYKAYPGNYPKLKSKNWNAIQIQGASYIIIDGFTLEGNNDNITLDYALAQKDNLNNPLTSGNGIGITAAQNGAKPHHVIVRNNEIYQFGGAGVYAAAADYVTIENNSVHDNALYSPYGNSGITTGGWNSDSNTGYKMIIRGNTVYRNQELVPWYKVKQITDGNGIIVDTNRNIDNGIGGGAYNGRTLIENNVVYGNGGRAINIFNSDRVDVFNNTTYQNSQHPDIKDGEITAIEASDVRVYNNIIYATTGRPANTVANATDVSYDYNLVFNQTSFVNASANNKVGQDPQFVNPSVGDFSLQAGSPAVDAGGGFTATQDRYGTQRPQGTGVDIGAIETKANSQGSQSGTKAGTLQADLIQGSNQADVLDGKQGNDTLIGNAGDDMLVGGLGNDVLNGGKGNDRLIGGAGNDTLSGGTDRDVFGFGRGEGRDTIQDFRDRLDKIELFGNLRFSDLTIKQQGNNTLLSVGQNQLALIKNISVGRISVADFI